MNSKYFETVFDDGTKITCLPDEYICITIVNNKYYYESRELEHFSKYIPHNGVIYDIGANIGNHTIFFSKKTNPNLIYAFEPIEENYELLVKNININDLKNVKAYNLAIGDKVGYVDKVINSKNMGSCRILREKEGSIRIRPIDEIDLEKPDFIKIDAEGFEKYVLLGMQNTLSNCSPVIWIEIDKDNFNDIDSLLSQMSYELVDKINFNHIYMKFNYDNSRFELLEKFKKNVMRETNQLILDRWNYSSWLVSEKDKVKNLESSNSLLKQDNEKQNNELEKTKIENQNQLIEKYEEIIKLKENINRLETECQELYNTLLKHIDSEKQVLNEYKELITRYEKVQKRYNALKKSKLGKVTTKIWELRSKLKERFAKK